MGSKTKIVVLHLKEIIYTGIFLALGILLIILLVVMFRPDAKATSADIDVLYTPGVYTSPLMLNNTQLDVEVSVDESRIQLIRFANMDPDLAATYPLIQPTMEEIAEQVCFAQSVEQISFPDETPYTSKAIITAIKEALQEAAIQ